METRIGIWGTTFLKDNIQYVDVFSMFVVPVKREYKAVLDFHVGVTYSRLKKNGICCTHLLTVQSSRSYSPFVIHFTQQQDS
jgi:hypothetical protein